MMGRRVWCVAGQGEAQRPSDRGDHQCAPQPLRRAFHRGMHDRITVTYPLGVGVSRDQPYDPGKPGNYPVDNVISRTKRSGRAFMCPARIRGYRLCGRGWATIGRCALTT